MMCLINLPNEGAKVRAIDRGLANFTRHWLIMEQSQSTEFWKSPGDPSLRRIGCCIQIKHLDNGSTRLHVPEIVFFI